MNKWLPEPNPHVARRVGKTCEEASELACVCARIAIQGLEAVDPSSGKTNRQRLLEESADTMAQIICNRAKIFTSEERAAMDQRTADKINQMWQWEDHYQ